MAESMAGIGCRGARALAPANARATKSAMLPRTTSEMPDARRRQRRGARLPRIRELPPGAAGRRASEGDATGRHSPTIHLGLRIMCSCMCTGFGLFLVNGSWYRFSRCDSFCRLSPRLLMKQAASAMAAPRIQCQSTTHRTSVKSCSLSCSVARAFILWRNCSLSTDRQSRSSAAAMKRGVAHSSRSRGKGFGRKWRG